MGPIRPGSKANKAISWKDLVKHDLKDPDKDCGPNWWRQLAQTTHTAQKNF